MLFKRLLTAALLIPLVFLGTLYLDNGYFAFALAPIVALGTWEYCQLIKIKHTALKLAYSLLVALAAISAGLCEDVLMPIIVLSCVWWGFNIVWISFYPKYSCCWYSGWSVRLVNGFLIFVPMLSALVALQRQNSELVLLLLVLIWSADSGAFFVGRAVGKHKLSSKVSPGKTIEGAIGGIITTLSMALLYVFILTEGATSKHYLIYAFLALSVAIAAIVGDLFESLFKRISNIKDSGNLLPGHGGIFDRIDSLTAAAPVFYLAYELLI